VPPLIASRGETALAAIQDVDSTSVDVVEDIVARNTNGEIVELVDVEVAAGQRGAEAVAVLGEAFNRGAVLVPQLIAGCVKTGRTAVNDVDGAGIGSRADILARHTNREIVESIVVEVAARGHRRVGLDAACHHEHRHGQQGEQDVPASVAPSVG
jgi:hypothetical protein